MNTIIIKNLIWQVILPLWLIVGLFGLYYLLRVGILFDKLKKESSYHDLTEFIQKNPGHPLVQEMHTFHRKSLITFCWMTALLMLAFFMGIF